MPRRVHQACVSATRQKGAHERSEGRQMTHTIQCTRGYIAVGYVGKHVRVATHYASGPLLVLLVAFAG
jgi:hypothetical protein